jgi:hypothetical protein
VAIVQSRCSENLMGLFIGLFIGLLIGLPDLVVIDSFMDVV